MSNQLNKKKLVEIINEFDSDLSKPISEGEISDKMRLEGEESQDDLESKAESMAFSFSENYQDENYSWGTYHGPKFVMGNGDGTVSVSPHINFVTSEMIDYWEKRISEVNHSVLKAKYADLVIDFSKKIKGKNADYKLATIVIDSTIQIAKHNLHKYYSAIATKLDRALQLAYSFNIPAKVNEVIETILEFDLKTEEEFKPGTWGIAYNILISRKKELSKDQLDEVINRLESRLAKSLTQKEAYEQNPYMVESPAMRLADYYNQINDRENLKRILGLIEQAYLSMQTHTAMHQVFNLEKIQKIYAKYGFREEELRILKLVSENRHKVLGEMQSVKTEITINKEEIDKFLDDITTGTLQDVLKKIEINYTPNFNEVEQQLSDLCSKSPISYLVSQSVIDHNGRKVAELKPIEQDPDGHLINLVRLNMSFAAWTLSDTIKMFIEKHELNETKIVDIFYESPVFDLTRKKVITRGVRAYIDGDYIAAISILIPQIEHIFRSLLQSMGELIEKPNNHGGTDYVSLNILLDKEILSKTFGEDRVKYWQILLTEALGLNMRNEFCHGIPDDEGFDQLRADRLFHILIFFALLRMKGD